AREHVQEAVCILDRALQLEPPTRAYHARRARYLEQLGDLAGARREMEQAAACQPTTALDHFLLGDDEQRQGQLPAAIRRFEEALWLQPDHFWARYFLAVCYLREAIGLQRPAEAHAAANAARDSLTVCIDKRPDFPWPYVLRGFAHGRLQEFAFAEKDFQ